MLERRGELAKKESKKHAAFGMLKFVVESDKQDENEYDYYDDEDDDYYD